MAEHDHHPEDADPEDADPEDDDGEESEKERLNREFDQLLTELRVALPGVQVLLAFLLTAPFADGFDRIDDDGRRVFLVAVVFAASASILLISPTVHHRLRFRQGAKEQMVLTGNVIALAGLGALGLAIACATYVLGDSAFPDTQARLLGPGALLLALVVWFIVPLGFRRTRPASSRKAEVKPDLF